MDTTKIFNLEAEKEILGSILNNNNSLYEVIDILEPEDFYSTNNQLIYETIAKMFQANKGIDITTLAEALGKKLAQVGGITYLSQLIESNATTNLVKNYAEIIKEKSNIRSIRDIVNNTVSEIESGELTSDAISSGIQDKLLMIKDNRKADDGNVNKALEKFMDKLQTRYKNGGDISGVKTWLTGLDKLLNGCTPKDFWILAARPSMGKSAVANIIAANTGYKSKKKVSLFSLEMGKDQLLDRMVAACGKIEMDHIKTGKLTDDEWTNVARTSGILTSGNLNIYDEIFTLNGIKAECKKRKLKEGLDIIIIDYLQLINTSGKFQSRENEVSYISRQLKLMAKELDCTVIALSQLSRAPEQRTDHRPMLSDLRESGGIEQDADIVIFLYRDEYYKPETEEKGIIEAIISKNRNGELGTIKLVWLPQYQFVCNLEKGMRYEGKYSDKEFKR